MSNNNQEKRTLVFDLPTRLFHWVFAACFIGAFAIGKFSDDEAAIYPLHAALGMIMILALVLRVIWGIVGTKYARFNSFKLNPADLIAYLSNMFSAKKPANLGRNPASSFAAIAMMIFAVLMGITGFNMAQGRGGHDLKEVHEIISTLFLLVAGLHIVGIVIHTITQKDPIGLSMIDGRKTSIDGQNGITNAQVLTGAAFLAALFGGGFALANSYDSNKHAFNIAGQNLVIGENEDHEKGEHHENGDDDEKNERGEENEKHEAAEYKENLPNNAVTNGAVQILPNSTKPVRESHEEESEEHERREHQTK